MTLHDAPSTAESQPLDDTAPERPPSRGGFSMKAAMIVPGLGLLILAVFIGASFLTSNPVQQTITSTGAVAVPGTTLLAQPAVKALKVITVSGEPPGNILNAVSIPLGARRVSYQNNSAAAEEYDAQITLTTDASQGAVEKFYTHDLKKQGWQVFDTGPAAHQAGALEVLSKKSGSDGFYWEQGVVVSATSFGNGAPAAGETSFSIELFQLPDPD
jgi:hypothetical protein